MENETRPPAADLPMTARPGVPMEHEPRVMRGAEDPLPAQPPTGRVTRRVELDALTPVFGTAQPPKLLSGALRRWAYRTPEHHTRHWMMLLLADRIDVLEHRAPRALPVVLPGLALLAAANGLQRLRG